MRRDRHSFLVEHKPHQREEKKKEEGKSHNQNAIRTIHLSIGERIIREPR